MAYFDVATLNNIEGMLLGQLGVSMIHWLAYAKRLLYFFACAEVAITGLMWMLSAQAALEKLFIKLIKISIILWVIESFPTIVSTLLESLFVIGQNIGGKAIEHLLANPVTLWRYSYNFSIHILREACLVPNAALSSIFIFLGFGCLLVMGIFIIQVIIQVASFYWAALMSLWMLPLSVLTPLRDFSSQSLKVILQSAISLLVQMSLVALAVMSLAAIGSPEVVNSMNINVPLGFFFSGLFFVMASAVLPKRISRLVGTVNWHIESEQKTEALAQTSVTTAPITHSSVVASANSLVSTPTTLPSSSLFNHSIAPTEKRILQERFMDFSKEYKMTEKNKLTANGKQKDIKKLLKLFQMLQDLSL